MLKIRENWTLSDDGNCVWIHRNGDHFLNAFAVVVTDGNATAPDAYSWVGAYPFGGAESYKAVWCGGPGAPVAKRFRTAAEAHAYLIACGSDSPWEVTP